MKSKWHIGKKTEKEKLLVTSNFSFSHDVLHSYVSLVRQNVALCGNGLIAIFQLSCAASLNLGRSQNGVLGYGLRSTVVDWVDRKSGIFVLIKP